MTQAIEDYAVIGNCETVALVGRNGSIDWLGFPRYDSAACFAALLGTEENGRWLIAPANEVISTKRRYREGTAVLETEFATAEGSILLIDCLDRSPDHADVLSLVRGLRGRVAIHLELVLRFEYGMVVPWVSRTADGRVRAVAGPDQVILSAPVKLEGRDLKTVADFTVTEGQEVPFSLRWSQSFHSIPSSPEVSTSVEHVTQLWRRWTDRYKTESPWREAVLRSLVTLKCLTHHATGGIVAAGTTSLPEQIGGERNWDYRYCWLRDATFTLFALLGSGFHDEAKAWREWLVRAAAGSPDKMQIMYGVAGERRLNEFEIPWLAGYGNSRPVRIGNAASEQVQLDVFGEVLDLLFQYRRAGFREFEASWSLEKALVEQLSHLWQEPDEGIWEIRGVPRHFTHSKVMAWVAVDRAVQTIEHFDAKGPLERFRKLRSHIHAEVCERGFNTELNSFVQYFGGRTLDASLLLLPLVGFLPPEDPRMVGTLAAIEKTLLRDGFVIRYEPESGVDGLRGSEGVFLACSFWLADNYVLQGRLGEAQDLFERLLILRNDVGLLAEEYDPISGRQLGNFPQAFSHVALVNTAHNLIGDHKPARHRSSSHRGAT
jgi:GH15 family glucan-1,4-alpha-glucosidase